MMSKDSNDTSVQVAVRIRPLNDDELEVDNIHYISADKPSNQVIAGSDTTFTFDHVFGPDTSQQQIFDKCVMDLVNSAFEGFNATVLAYGQTGSGKTFTMGSSSDMLTTDDMVGIIPRVISTLFDIVQLREAEDPNTSYKVMVQFIEIYGEDIRDLLDHTKTSKVTIRESVNGDVFVSGAKEEFVGSAVQMAKALEDGSRHRITGSTRMNSTSSRSHAIFTVILEQTIIIRNSVEETVASPSVGAEDELSSAINISQTRAEVRKSKFHFVDLAGSERAKRTGAQGLQLKEGIDINKGLLALGNVISALGDETKRGKVHVPYRDSKLTRILQDSLGGNSKTLFICCVSPAGINFTESLNALRYANRARNIKNKPIVNRDPTLVMIDELKGVIQVLGTELIQRRQLMQQMDPAASAGISNNMGDMYLPDETLEGLVSKTSTSQLSISPKKMKVSATTNNSNSTSNRIGGSSSNSMSSSNRQVQTPTYSNDAQILRTKLNESDREIVRLINELKLANQQRSDETERILLIESERDYYKMKWAALCPEEYASLMVGATSEDSKADGSSSESIVATNSLNSVQKEKNETVNLISNYLKEIDTLKREIAELRVHKAATNTLDVEFLHEETLLENELTSNVAKVIAQAQEHLRVEAMKLKAVSGEDANIDISNILSAVGSINGGSDAADDVNRTLFSEDDPNNSSNNSNSNSSSTNGSSSADNNMKLVEVEEAAFQIRQKQLASELQHIGESIQLKEQLVQQLQKSQYQYTVMKAFYEQKLTALEEEMNQKQLERQQIENELQELLKKGSTTTVSTVRESTVRQDREIKLREELKRRDDELKLLKKKQDELNSLSQVQTRYLKQVSKLESEIESMKKNRVELSKTLQFEKKKHLLQLNNKAKEIDKLKRELSKSLGEVKGLKREKERAEERTKEALREGAMYRKKATDLQKTGVADLSSTSGGTNGMNASLASAKTARKAINSAGVPSNTRSQIGRILSEDQLKTRKWLDDYITNINLRERAAENLRRQCEIQLSLVCQKEMLERKLQQFVQQQQQLQQQQQTTAANTNTTTAAVVPWTEEDDNALIDVLESYSINNNKSNSNSNANSIDSDDNNNAISSTDTFQRLLSQTNSEYNLLSNNTLSSDNHNRRKVFAADYKPTIEDIKDRVHSMNEQLKLRNKKIYEMQQQLNTLDEKLGDEKSFEQLKKSATASLTASQDLIKVMFEMLLSSRRNISSKNDMIQLLENKEKRLRNELIESTNQIYQLERSHDAALTKVMNEYEIKLNGLFSHSAVGQVLLSESGLPVAVNDSASSHLQSVALSGIDHVPTTGSVSASASISSSLQSYKMLLAISTEQCNNLKFQLQREEHVITELRRRIEESDQQVQSLVRDLDDRNMTIGFLEEERHLFRNLSEDYKSIILAMGGSIGESIVKQLKEKTIEKAPQSHIIQSQQQQQQIHSSYSESNSISGSTATTATTSAAATAVATAITSSSSNPSNNHGVYRASIFLQEDESDDEDSQSVLDAYTMIAEEISRTGRITQENTNSSNGNNSSNSNSSNNNSNSYGSNSSKGVVYDRLTNPSNFTGSMKHLFEQDLAVKRQKVQRIKKEMSTSSNNNNNSNLNSSNSGSNSNANNTNNNPNINNIPARSSFTSISNNNTSKSATQRSESMDSYEGNIASSVASIGSTTQGQTGIVRQTSSSSRIPTSITKSQSNREVYIDSTDAADQLTIEIDDINLSITNSSGGSNSGGNASSSKNVFNRLSKHYTGIHKHMHNSDANGVATDSQDFRGVIEGIGYRNIDLSMLETLSPTSPESGNINSNSNSNNSTLTSAGLPPRAFDAINDEVSTMTTTATVPTAAAISTARSTSTSRNKEGRGNSDETLSQEVKTLRGTGSVSVVADRPRTNSKASSSKGSTGVVTSPVTVPNAKPRGQINLDLSSSSIESSPNSPNSKFAKQF